MSIYHANHSQNYLNMPAVARSILASCGSTLRSAREAKQFSVEHVHDMIKILPEHISAIERGAAEELPSFELYLSFLKNYSRFLGLNAEHLISDFKKNNFLADLMLGERNNISFYNTDKPEKQNIQINAQPAVMNVIQQEAIEITTPIDFVDISRNKQTIQAPVQNKLMVAMFVFALYFMNFALFCFVFDKLYLASK